MKKEIFIDYWETIRTGTFNDIHFCKEFCDYYEPVYLCVAEKCLLAAFNIFIEAEKRKQFGEYCKETSLKQLEKDIMIFMLSR